VETRLKEEVLGVLAERKSAPEFFRVFTISVKLTNLELEEIVIEECWL
jgi:hypothetical protein